jgi:hypothetical protein
LFAIWKIEHWKKGSCNNLTGNDGNSFEINVLLH